METQDEEEEQRHDKILKEIMLKKKKRESIPKQPKTDNKVVSEFMNKIWTEWENDCKQCKDDSDKYNDKCGDCDLRALRQEMTEDVQLAHATPNGVLEIKPLKRKYVKADNSKLKPKRSKVK